MELLKRGTVFWMLLAVSVVLPASAQSKLKKQLFHANIANSNGAGIGSSQVALSNNGSQPGYIVRTFNAGGHAVTKVALTSDDGSWGALEIVLCENGTSAGDCTYDDTHEGNLDLEGAIVAPMLPAGLTGRQFDTALHAGVLRIRLNDEGLGSGLYFRIF